jgi:hypothetical protein
LRPDAHKEKKIKHDEQRGRRRKNEDKWKRAMATITPHRLVVFINRLINSGDSNSNKVCISCSGWASLLDLNRSFKVYMKAWFNREKSSTMSAITG